MIHGQRVVAIIQARLGSTRFPGKALHEIRGEPLLGCLLQRIARSTTLNDVLVATTQAAQDEPIVSLCQARGIQVLRGSELDVLDRYYRGAQQTRADVIVRLTSDCPLIDPGIVDQLVDTFLRGPYDYVANTVPLPTSFPDGMDVEVLSRRALEQAWRGAVKPSDREHVTFYIWQRPHLFRTHRVEHWPDWSGYRLTVDYPDDARVIEAIVQAFGPRHVEVSMDELIMYLERHPEVRRLNQRFVRNAGWESALERDRVAGHGD